VLTDLEDINSANLQDFAVTLRISLPFERRGRWVLVLKYPLPGDVEARKGLADSSEKMNQVLTAPKGGLQPARLRFGHVGELVHPTYRVVENCIFLEQRKHFLQRAFVDTPLVVTDDLFDFSSAADRTHIHSMVVFL
jgi:hypothetical protein